MLIPIAISFVVLLAGLLIFAATRPDTFGLQRAIRIKAPPEKIYPLINDFHGWAQWSPYERKDAAMKKTYTGSPSGVGAVYEWEGNNKVGMGRMEITETSSPSRVIVKLDFLKPFEGHNVAEFTLAARDGFTDVTWAMRGPSPFMSKLMGVLINMDKLIGKDFEAGLINLKTAAEA